MTQLVGAPPGGVGDWSLFAPTKLNFEKKNKTKMVTVHSL